MNRTILAVCFILALLSTGANCKSSKHLKTCVQKLQEYVDAMCSDKQVVSHLQMLLYGACTKSVLFEDLVEAACPVEL